jgi:hypothetical protein
MPRELCHESGHGCELKGQRARVGDVGQHEIQHRCQLRLCKVAPTVGHRAVGNFEHGFEHRNVRRVGAEGAPHEPRRRERSLQAATDVEEQPPVAARHALHLHPAERRQVRDHPVQVHEHVIQLDAPVPEMEILLQLIEDAPRVERKPIADGGGNPAHFAEVRT